MSYLTELTLRLALGASQLDYDTKSLHRLWLQAQQRDDGGFAGREGSSDPYYTSFALRGLLIVDGIDSAVATRASDFIRSQFNSKLGIVDLISLIMAASILEFAQGSTEMQTFRSSHERIAEELMALRSDDGGYAKTPGGVAGSTYQTFLNLLTWELIGREEPAPERVALFLDSQRQFDGGFREIRVAKRAGVNPTAAGIGALKTLRRLQVDRETATAEFLAEMQTDQGGMAANDRIPMPDLLSSCTGLISLIDLEATEMIDIDRLIKYARSMERREVVVNQSLHQGGLGALMMDTQFDDDEDGGEPQVNSRNTLPGGFHGFEFDEDVDVEYTFYGLACLALAAHVLESQQNPTA